MDLDHTAQLERILVPFPQREVKLITTIWGHGSTCRPIIKSGANPIHSGSDYVAWPFLVEASHTSTHPLTIIAFYSLYERFVGVLTMCPWNANCRNSIFADMECNRKSSPHVVVVIMQLWSRDNARVSMKDEKSCCSFQELLTMDQKWGEEEVFYNAVMMRMISLFVVLLHIIFAHYFVCKHVHVPPTPQLSFSASTKSSYCCRLLFIIFGILACQFGYYCVHTC